MPANPPDVTYGADLILWLKADAILGLVDGDPITTWPDSSASLNNAVQAVGASKPIYKTGIIGGMPVARFSPVTKFMDFLFDIDTVDSTVYLVLRHPNTIGATGIQILLIGDANANPAAGYIAFGNATSNLTNERVSFLSILLPQTYGVGDNVGADIPAGNHLYTMDLNGTVERIRQNGSDLPLQESITGGMDSSTEKRFNNVERLGKDSDFGGGGFPFEGDVAEIIVIDRSSSASEISDTEAYLAAKYGLTFDADPPQTITDLTVTGTTSTSITYQWTAPYEDSLNPGSGAVASYDHRSRIGLTMTEAEYGTATPSIGEPAPATPGTLQTFTLIGLTPDTDYAAGIKSIDAATNVSALSNIATAHTPAVDVTPPSATTGASFTASPVVGDGTLVDLAWDEGADDPPATGNVTFRRIARKATPFILGPGAQADFDANVIRTTPPDAPAIAAPATARSHQDTGRTIDTDYYYAIQTEDDAGNLSAIEYDSVHTTDTLAPGGVTDIIGTGTSTTTSDLQWDETGDNSGFPAPADHRVIRWKLAPFTLAQPDFDAANLVTDAQPAMAAANTTVQMIVTGLPPGSSIWFAIQVFDEAGNAGPIEQSAAPAATFPIGGFPNKTGIAPLDLLGLG